MRSTCPIPRMQVLGENVMLMRVLLEAVGAVARSVGSRFATTGGLLRAVLLPALERLGEGCGHGVAWMCIWTGLRLAGGLPQIRSRLLVWSSGPLMNRFMAQNGIR